MKQILIAIILSIPIIGMEPKYAPSRTIEDLFKKNDIVRFVEYLCAIKKDGSGLLEHRSPPFFIKVSLAERKIFVHEIDFPDVIRHSPSFELGVDDFCQLALKYKAALSDSNAK